MFPNLNPFELMVVLGVAVLLFGKKLPEVSRSLGKGFLEFKKSIRGFEDEFKSISRVAEREMSAYTTDFNGALTNDNHVVTAPKFVPPSTSPVPRLEHEPNPYINPNDPAADDGLLT